ncbi:hypothetical protein WJX74_010667 [Apatococcus lobatus]|uniref:Uncharacterized protein n=1 Tax=Apatococcus lobatus TaxID=904363 RepID=A0AAW1Q2A8_9CHLO
MADLRQAVFQRLRPICAQLLPLRSSAGRLARELDSLQVVICSANLEGLASCLEYVLFPLLFLVDSICAVRRRSGSGGASEPPAFPAAASGQVAERGLACCRAVLSACPPTHPTQLINLLQRFGAVAALPRDAATEEVRMGGVACLISVLQHSAPNGSREGTRAMSPAAPTTIPPEMRHKPTAGAFDAAENQPLLAYIAHTLLGVAAGEAAAGAQGSRALRAAALKALRLLLEHAGQNAAALAAILPGTASGLAQALQAAMLVQAAAMAHRAAPEQLLEVMLQLKLL